MKQSKQLTRILKWTILDAVAGGLGLFSLFISILAWPLYIVGLLGLSGWQHYRNGKDQRRYRWRTYNWIFPWIAWFCGMLAFTFFYWAIAWGFGLRG